MENNKNNKKNKRFPLRMIATYLFVISFLLTGVTFSRYVSEGYGRDFARVAAFGDLDMYEINVDGTRKTESTVENITPGVDIFKNSVVNYAVKNTSEMSAYVFLLVRTNGWSFNDNYSNYINSLKREGEATSNLLSCTVDNTNWTYLTTENYGSGVSSRVYYKEIEPGENINNAPVLKEYESGSTIKVSPQITADELERIAVTAENIEFQSYAVQAGGFNAPIDAWKAVSGK